MITTGCEGCCFLKSSDKGKGCILSQVCALKNEQAFAPGYCRLCRSHKWAKQQEKKDLQQLYTAVLNECELKFDMLVYFDEFRNSIRDLERTLNSDWYIKYAQKIIIMDVTGFGKRKNLAFQYLTSRKHSIPTVVDSSAIKESVHQYDETIRRVSNQVTAPFFLAIPASKIIDNFNRFAIIIQQVSSRVIHWSFPFKIGSTAIVPNNLHCGLFITIPYRALIKSSETGLFAQQFKKEEIETEMALSWFCENCWMI
jgi:hypothetical protein